MKKFLLLCLMTIVCGCEGLSFSSIKNNFDSNSSTSSNIVVSSDKNNPSSSTTSISNSTSSNTVQSSMSSSTSNSSNVITSSSNSSNVITSTSSSNAKPSISSSSKVEEDNEPKVIDIYATNDFHGRISSGSNYVPGISKMTTYLKNQKALNSDGFVYINSGDYWQDTYESGYNKGKLLTECLDIMECEVLTLGNHEFDWGIDIRENKQYVSYTKFLGANIREYPDTSKQVDFAEPYKIIQRDGLNIGIIGAIGKDQITSITSSNWENITFLEHAPIVKELSDELRTEKDCDIVILSIHADESVSAGSEITKVSPVSNKKYVDAVFCAHSHHNIHWERSEHRSQPVLNQNLNLLLR